MKYRRGNVGLTWALAVGAACFLGSYGLSLATVAPVATETTGLVPSAVVGAPSPVAFVPAGRYCFSSTGGAPAQSYCFNLSGTQTSNVAINVDPRGFDFNPNTGAIQAVSFNACCAAGANTGIESVAVSGSGDITGAVVQTLAGPIAALGDAQTNASLNPTANVLYAKQLGIATVNIVNNTTGAAAGTIVLNLAAAGVTPADVASRGVHYTGRPGEELVILDGTNRRALVFNLSGAFVGASALPGNLTINAADFVNNGNGFANGLFFAYDSLLGATGTYRAFNVFAAVPPAAIATPLGDWLPFALALLLAGAAAMRLRRR